MQYGKADWMKWPPSVEKGYVEMAWWRWCAPVGAQGVDPQSIAAGPPRCQASGDEKCHLCNHSGHPILEIGSGQRLARMFSRKGKRHSWRAYPENERLGINGQHLPRCNPARATCWGEEVYFPCHQRSAHRIHLCLLDIGPTIALVILLTHSNIAPEYCLQYSTAEAVYFKGLE